MPDELERVTLADRAEALLMQAESRGMEMRLGGSLAIRDHCQGTTELLQRWGRELPVDIDLFTRKSQQRAVEEMFKELGYTLDPALAYSQEYDLGRLVYHGPGAVKVDVFLDVLRMAHPGRVQGQALS